jgi:Spy/CpxP family protein refolding chaperone
MKRATVVMISVLLVLGALSSLYGEYRGIFRNKKIARELKLNDEQIKTIKELVKNTEKQMIQLRADMETKEVDLRDILDEDEPDESKAISLVKDIMKLKTEQRVLKIKQLIRIKKTLSPEQIEKFHEIKHEMRKKAMRKGKEGRELGPKREGPPPPE